MNKDSEPSELYSRTTHIRAYIKYLCLFNYKRYKN